MGKINYSLVSLKKRIKSNQLVKSKKKLSVKITKIIPTYDFIIHRLPIDSKKQIYSLLIGANIPDKYVLAVTVYSDTLQILNKGYFIGTGQTIDYVCSFYQSESNISVSFKLLLPSDTVLNAGNTLTYHIMNIVILSDIPDYDKYTEAITSLSNQIYLALSSNNLTKIMEFTAPIEYWIKLLINEYHLDKYYAQTAIDIHCIMMKINNNLVYGNIRKHDNSDLMISTALWNTCIYFGNNIAYILSNSDNINSINNTINEELDKEMNMVMNMGMNIEMNIENFILTYNEYDGDILQDKQIELQCLAKVKTKLEHEMETYKKSNSMIMYQKMILDDIDKEIMVLHDFKILMENEIKNISIHLSTAKNIKDISRNPISNTLYKILKGYYLRMGYDILHTDKRLADYYMIQKYLRDNISSSDSIANKLTLYRTHIHEIDEKIINIINDIKQYKTKDKFQTLIVFKILDKHLGNIIKNTLSNKIIS